MSQFMLFATEQELPGVLPPCLPYSTAVLVNREPFCPPFPDPAGMLVSPHKGTSL